MKSLQREYCEIIEKNPGMGYLELAFALGRERTTVIRGAAKLARDGWIYIEELENIKHRNRKIIRIYRTEKPIELLVPVKKLVPVTGHQKRWFGEIAAPDLCIVMHEFIIQSRASLSI